MAIAGSMLIGILLVMVDMGQYITMNQIVSNASRAGARHACRSSTVNVSEVQSSVQSYLEDCLPNESSSTISNALTETLSDENDSAITGAISVDVGDPIYVNIQFDYDDTRWITTQMLTNRSIDSTTVMRRE